MTRLLCMRLGTGQPGATLLTCILRDGSPRTQADMWSSVALVIAVVLVNRLGPYVYPVRHARAAQTLVLFRNRQLGRRPWVGVGEIPWDSPPKSGSHRT